MKMFYDGVSCLRNRPKSMLADTLTFFQVDPVNWLLKDALMHESR